MTDYKFKPRLQSIISMTEADRDRLIADTRREVFESVRNEITAIRHKLYEASGWWSADEVSGMLDRVEDKTREG